MITPPRLLLLLAALLLTAPASSQSLTTTHTRVAEPFEHPDLAASLAALRRHVHAERQGITPPPEALDAARDHLEAALRSGTLGPEALPAALLHAQRLFAERGEARAAAITAAVGRLALPSLRDTLEVETVKALRRSGDDEPAQVAAWLAPLEGRGDVEGADVMLLDARLRAGLSSEAAEQVLAGLEADRTHLCELYPGLTRALSAQPLLLARLTGTARATCATRPQGVQARTVAALLQSGLVLAPRVELEAALRWTPKRRLTAARHLYRRVQHDAVLDVVAPLVEDAEAPTELRCEAIWRRAMTLRRSRRATQSMDAYALMKDACAELPGWHMRALYGMGWNHFRKDRFDQAQAWFEQLFERYADTRYGDDALFYLVRVHVARGDLDAAEATLEPILTGRVAGDLHGEAVWRYIDVALGERPEAARGVLERARLALSDDPNYNSEGRWTFLLGFLALEAEDTDAAIAHFEDVVYRFPLSFYGYLAFSHLHALAESENATARAAMERWRRALERSREPARDLRIGPLPDDALTRRALALIAGGWSARAAWLLEASLESPAPAQRWLIAFAYQAGGRVDRSHDLTRGSLRGWDARLPDPQNRALWELAYPRPYTALIAAAREHDPIDESFVYAIMREESAFRHGIESFAHAVGLMQIIEPTGVSHAKRAYGWEITLDDLRRPDINIPTGVAFLAHLERKLRAHPLMMAAGYNAGRGASNKWFKRRGHEPVHLWAEHTPYNETRNYAKRVNRTRFVYQFLYRPEGVAPIPLAF